MILNKIQLAIVAVFCCFFQNAQGHYTREQLEKYFGKSVFSYVHMIDFMVVDQWLYTTELSKILLVGDNAVLDYVKAIPVAGIVARIVEPVVKNRFSDTRFVSFVENVGKYSQQELQEAIQDAILLSSASTQAYSTLNLLDYLIAALRDKIIVIKRQMKHDFKYDQKSLQSLKKSALVVVGLMACIAVTSKNASGDDKSEKKTVSKGDTLNALAVLCLLPASYKLLKSCYAVLTIDPNAYNNYLDEYQNLLIFVQKLKKDLKRNGTLSFKLSNGCIATVHVHDNFLGSYEALSFDLETH